MEPENLFKFNGIEAFIRAGTSGYNYNEWRGKEWREHFYPEDVPQDGWLQSLLPDDFPAAFEFRHKAWDSDETSAALAEHGHARVVAHSDDEPLSEIPDNDLIYLRLRGSQGSQNQAHRCVLTCSRSARGCTFRNCSGACIFPCTANLVFLLLTSRKILLFLRYQLRFFSINHRFSNEGMTFVV